jgi:hypothetical protein
VTRSISSGTTGAGFVVRLVSTRPDLVRSWVTDAAGIGDVEGSSGTTSARSADTTGRKAFWDQQLG